MSTYRQPYFFPVEFVLFSFFVSYSWIFLIWKAGIPFILGVETLVRPLAIGGLLVLTAEYAFVTLSLLLVVGFFGYVWWKLGLKWHWSLFSKLVKQFYWGLMPPQWLLGLFSGK